MRVVDEFVVQIVATEKGELAAYIWKAADPEKKGRMLLGDELIQIMGALHFRESFEVHVDPVQGLKIISAKTGR